MTDQIIRSPLWGRDIETESGDILLRRDAAEEIPDLYQPIREPYLLEQSVAAHAESAQYRKLAAKGSHDTDVKKAGGVKACQAKALAAEQRARTMYLDSQGLPISLSAAPSDEERIAFDESVRAWGTFRETVLNNPDELAALEDSCKFKISVFKDSVLGVK